MKTPKPARYTPVHVTGHRLAGSVVDWTCLFQLIQMVTGVDADEPQGGQHFSYSLALKVSNNPNFTLRDNQGTAWRTSAKI